MTDEQIIKALAICTSEHLGCEDGCPYRMGDCLDDGYRSAPMKDALDLIKRQRGELRKKQVRIHKLLKEANQIQDYYDIQKAEIERLKNAGDNKTKELLRLNSTIEELHKKIKTAKSEAIKEVAESFLTEVIKKCQKRYCLLDHNKYTEGYTVDDILSTIDIVKEMMK